MKKENILININKMNVLVIMTLKSHTKIFEMQVKRDSKLNYLTDYLSVKLL